MKKIVIKDRTTGEITHELTGDKYQVSREPSKHKVRKSGVFTPAEFDWLCEMAMSGTRGGKRVEAARQVMTGSISCTDAAKQAGITPSSVTQLVLKLEACHKQLLKEDYKKHTETLLAEKAKKEQEKAPEPAGPPKMSSEDFYAYLAMVPKNLTVRGADSLARLVLTNGVEMKNAKRSYTTADSSLAEELIAHIRHLQAEDEADLLDGLE